MVKLKFQCQDNWIPNNSLDELLFCEIIGNLVRIKFMEM